MLAALGTQPFLRRLDDAQAERLLGLAVRENASVLIEPTSDPPSPVLIGHVLSGDSDGMVLVLNSDDSPVVESLCKREWEVRVLLGEQTYSFVTRILETDNRGPSLAAYIPWPEQLYAEMRRKYQRFRFAEPSSVQLAWQYQGCRFSATGELCNVGADGMAVLIDNTADNIAEGTALTVQFKLPACPDFFVVPAFVRALTSAGDAAHIIVRIRFHRGASEKTDHALAVLDQFLHEYIAGKAVREQSI